MLLKDCLEDEDDFKKMHDLIEQMAGIDAEQAFDMWYPLLNKYENYVTKSHVNETYYFVSNNLDTLGEALGYTKLDSLILHDNYLYDLLIKRYCCAINHYNYTQKMLERIMMSNQIDLADKIFADAYSNGNNSRSWFDIIDGFMYDIKYNKFVPNKKSIGLLSKWAAKVSGKKDKAKIMSAILATGLDFDFDALAPTPEIDVKQKTKTNLTEDDFSQFCELIAKYPEAIKDRLRLKALLSDYYPEKKIYSNIILMVFDAGMIPEIKKMSDSDFLKKQRLVARLVNNYGISEDLACAAIDAWIKGMN